MPNQRKKGKEFVGLWVVEDLKRDVKAIAKCGQWIPQQAAQAAPRFSIKNLQEPVFAGGSSSSKKVDYLVD